MAHGDHALLEGGGDAHFQDQHSHLPVKPQLALGKPQGRIPVEQIHHADRRRKDLGDHRSNRHAHHAPAQGDHCQHIEKNIAHRRYQQEIQRCPAVAHGAQNRRHNIIDELGQKSDGIDSEIELRLGQ